MPGVSVLKPKLSWCLLGSWCVLACTSEPDAGSSGDTSGSTSMTPSDESSGDDSEGDAADTVGASTGAADEGSSDGAGAEFPDQFSLPVTYPEGGAFDPTGNVFYVGTLEGGAVVGIDALTGDSLPLFDDDLPETWMTLGMAVDAAARRLWVCAANRETDPFTGQIWVFDLTTAERTHAIDLTFDGAPAWCEDVAVASDGTAYATDRENPNIYVVDDSFTAELFASDPALGSKMLGQNGIVVLPGDEALIAAIHAPPQLNRVSIPDGTVTPITINGDFTDVGLGVGADGMVYVDETLFVVFDGKLARVTPQADDWSEVESTTVEWDRGLTDVLASPAGLYLLNGQAIRFALGQEPLGPFELVRFTGTF